MSGSAVRSEAQYTGSGRAARVFDRGAQRVDVAGVARQLLGPVVEHGDRRAVGSRRPALQDTPVRGARPAARTRIRSSARCRTGTRAAGGGSPHRPGRGRCAPARATPAGTVEWLISSASGACSPLTTTVGTPLRDDGVDAVLPGPVAAEDPHHDEVGAVEQLLELTVDEPRRVGPPVPRTAGARGDQVGVGRRQQQNGRIWHPPLVPHRPATGAGPIELDVRFPSAGARSAYTAAPVMAISRPTTAAKARSPNIVVPSIAVLLDTRLVS